MDKSTGNLPAVIEGIMTAMTFSKREEVKAWEQEFVSCEHTLCLTQEDVADSESKGTAHADAGTCKNTYPTRQILASVQPATCKKTSGFAWNVVIPRVGVASWGGSGKLPCACPR